MAWLLSQKKGKNKYSFLIHRVYKLSTLVLSVPYSAKTRTIYRKILVLVETFYISRWKYNWQFIFPSRNLNSKNRCACRCRKEYNPDTTNFTNKIQLILDFILRTLTLLYI